MQPITGDILVRKERVEKMVEMLKQFDSGLNEDSEILKSYREKQNGYIVNFVKTINEEYSDEFKQLIDSMDIPGYTKDIIKDLAVNAEKEKNYKQIVEGILEDRVSGLASKSRSLRRKMEDSYRKMRARTLGGGKKKKKYKKTKKGKKYKNRSQKTQKKHKKLKKNRSYRKPKKSKKRKIVRNLSVGFDKI